MLCQKCGKNAPEVRLVQALNDEKIEIMLCGKCALEEGINVQIPFVNFLQGFISASQTTFSEENTGVKCPCCGMSLGKIKAAGKAGCCECYNVFRKQFDAVLKNVQAGNSHTGKIPKRMKHLSVEKEVGALKCRLEAAVAKEEYEEAALIRDEIRRLKGGGRVEEK